MWYACVIISLSNKLRSHSAGSTSALPTNATLVFLLSSGFGCILITNPGIVELEDIDIECPTSTKVQVAGTCRATM